MVRASLPRGLVPLTGLETRGYKKLTQQKTRPEPGSEDRERKP